MALISKMSICCPRHACGGCVRVLHASCASREARASGAVRIHHGLSTETPLSKIGRQGGPAPARMGAMVSVASVGMSPREAEVLEALSDGLTNAQIGQRLHISVRTVESHVSSLLRK